MKAGLDLKLANCRHGHFFDILSTPRSLGKFNFHQREKCTASPSIGKGSLKTIGRCMILHFCVCFGDCSQADSGILVLRQIMLAFGKRPSF